MSLKSAQNVTQMPPNEALPGCRIYEEALKQTQDTLQRCISANLEMPLYPLEKGVPKPM